MKKKRSKQEMLLFSIVPRTPHSNDWRLDRHYKSSGLILSNGDTECRFQSDRPGHQFIFGTKMFSSGKHAWRTVITGLSSNQWIFMGIGRRKKSFYRGTLSFSHEDSWGFSTQNQTYAGGVKKIKSNNINYRTTAIDWLTGHVIDCLLDLDVGTLCFRNNNTTHEFKLQGIPRRSYWPHYNFYYSSNAVKVQAIHPREYGVGSSLTTTTTTPPSVTINPPHFDDIEAWD